MAEFHVENAASMTLQDALEFPGRHFPNMNVVGVAATNGDQFAISAPQNSLDRSRMREHCSAR